MCASVPLRKKRKEMSARAGAKECCLGASVIGISYFLLRERRAEVLEKDLGCARNSKELIVEWGAAASSIKARSLVVLNPHVKGNCVFLGRGDPLIF